MSVLYMLIPIIYYTITGILDGEVTDMQVVSAWQAAVYRTLHEGREKIEASNLMRDPTLETKVKKGNDSDSNDSKNKKSKVFFKRS